MFDSVGSLTWFLGASPRQKAILQRYLKSEDISDVIVDDSLPEEDRELADKLVVGSKQRQVPRLCETRWSARVTTLSSVIAKYRAIVLALRDIVFESCSSEFRANALYYINLLESSPLLVALVVAQYILSFSKPLCLALQKESTDIIEAYEKAKTCCSAIKAQRSDDKSASIGRK